MKMRYYLMAVSGDSEPTLSSGFALPQTRDAYGLFAHRDDDLIYRLDVDFEAQSCVVSLALDLREGVAS